MVSLLLEELLKVVSKGSDNQKLVDTPCIEPLVIPPSVMGLKKSIFMLILKCLKVVNLVF